MRELDPAPELVVHDEEMECPYLPDERARMPFRLPLVRLDRRDLDKRLAAGDRRTGIFLYKQACPMCRACESTRVPVDEFQMSRSMQRVWKRGRRLIHTEIGPVESTPEKVELYNRHKAERGLMQGEQPLEESDYRTSFGNSCCETFELRFRVDGRLVSVAIADRGETSLSAVYCFFNPDFSRLSPGVYSILQQIDLCRAWGLQWLYLGLTIADCKAMNYKTRYRPHQRLIDGQWRLFS